MQSGIHRGSFMALKGKGTGIFYIHESWCYISELVHQPFACLGSKACQIYLFFFEVVVKDIWFLKTRIVISLS